MQNSQDLYLNNLITFSSQTNKKSYQVYEHEYGKQMDALQYLVQLDKLLQIILKKNNSFY
jgi:hypothetical protein